jgi:hypothetical protein
MGLVQAGVLRSFREQRAQGSERLRPQFDDGPRIGHQVLVPRGVHWRASPGGHDDEALAVPGTGAVRDRPLLDPVVVRSSMGAPSSTPVGPPFSRKPATIGWFMSAAPSATMRRL